MQEHTGQTKEYADSVSVGHIPAFLKVCPGYTGTKSDMEEAAML